MDPNNYDIFRPAYEDEDIPYDPQDANDFRLLVVENKWEEVLEKYEEHVFFHKIKIKGRGTALHVAISIGKEDIVKRLVDVIVKKHNDQSGFEIKTERGDTPLHLAAYRGFTSMCQCIIGKYGERKDLIQVKNINGETPLFSAVLVRNEETFIYLHQFFISDINIAINFNGATILQVAIQRELFGMADIIMHLYPIFSSMEDNHGVSPLEILATRTSAFESSDTQLSWSKQILYYCVSVKVRDTETRIEYVKNIMFEDVEDKEKDHQSELSLPISIVDESHKTSKVRHLARVDFTSCAKISCYNIAKFVFRWCIPLPLENGTDDTAYLRAAKHGITEIMRVLESKLNSVIHETNSDNENALLIAVKYRQPQVVEGLRKRLTMETFKSLSLEVNNNENTILHLAACRIDNEKSWKVSGAGMQMMWDIKWYKYIKGLEPEHFNHRSNKEGKTPSEIFKKEREELLQNSTQWLIDTTQSCSAVAAIVAGISFATLSSVPGGNKETGKSSSEEHTALEGFAISSLIGVYFSVTALILFLSILIDRKQVEDFDRNLPLKLLIGLTSVFVSIVAVFVSFCTGHFLTLSDKYTMGGILFYLYVLICLPVTLYALVQFRLYVDLVKVLWKKVPPPSIKGVKL